MQKYGHEIQLKYEHEIQQLRQKNNINAFREKHIFGGKWL
jgi:hypothetical protein